MRAERFFLTLEILRNVSVGIIGMLLQVFS